MTGRSHSWYAAAVLLAGWATCLAVPASQTSAPDAVRAQIEAGRQLFVTTCAGCHGATGNGAIGPALAGRGLSFDVIRDTVVDGRTGAPMPAFKSEFDAKSLAEIVSYVQWLTSGGRLPTAFITAESMGDVGAGAARLSEPVAVGTKKGIPAHGATLFFDATNLHSCRTCHSFANKGGPIGMDLKNLSYTPVQIYQSITRRNVATPDFPAVRIALRDGARATGVKSEETADSLSYFDVSSLPPVKVTVMKSEIAEVDEVKDSGIFDHTRLPYSDQDLVDLSAYLGKPSAQVNGK